jgi:hypothetical protein
VMPTLVTGDLRRSETQLTEQTKRITRRYRDISVAPVIIDKDTNREKQVVTIRKTLVLDTATPLLPTAIKDTKFDVLGNGLAVQTEISIDAVFVGAVYEKSILNLIPERFRADVPQRKHDFTVQNSAVSVNPPLATGDLTRRETQIDEFNKRVEISSIDTTEIPKTVTDKGLTREFGGSETTIWFTLDVTGSQVIETGKRVIDSKIQRLGNGYEVLVTERAVDTDWAELSGQDYDERFDVILPFTQQVKTAGVDLGTPRTEIKPLDKWRQQNRTVDIEAIQDFLDDYLLEYAGRTNVDLPDKLVGISAVMVSDQGEGTSEETGDIAFTGNYSISMALRATAQSSLNKIPEVMTDIKQFWGNNIPCLNYQFFLPSPVTAADILTKITAITGGVVTTWPKYNPEMVSLVIRGGRVSVQVSASSQGSDAVNDSGTSSTTGGGTGYSREVGLSVKSMRISPTIHGEIVISGTTTASGTVSATATAEATGLGPFETETQTGDASASITPTTIPATAGDVSWPDSGKFLYRVDAQPYRFGYIQVHAIVVDTADFPTSP